MALSKKRHTINNDENNSSKKLKQQPIASFFRQTTIKKSEETVIFKREETKPVDLAQNNFKENSVEANEEEDTIVEQEAVKSEFFETSIYTDEFNRMIDIVLEGERYLFDQSELVLFDTYKSLHGTCL